MRQAKNNVARGSALGSAAENKLLTFARYLPVVTLVVGAVSLVLYFVRFEALSVLWPAIAERMHKIGTLI